MHVDIRAAGSILVRKSSWWRVHDNPFQCLCLENPMDRQAWWMQSIGPSRAWDMEVT